MYYLRAILLPLLAVLSVLSCRVATAQCVIDDAPNMSGCAGSVTLMAMTNNVTSFDIPTHRWYEDAALTIPIDPLLIDQGFEGGPNTTTWASRYTVNITQTDTFYVTIVCDGVESAAQSVIYTVTGSGGISISTGGKSNTDVCEGDEGFMLMALNTDGSQSIEWKYIDELGQVGVVAVNTIIYTPDQGSGTYRVIATSSCGALDSASLPVTFRPTLGTLFAPGNEQVCQQDTRTYRAIAANTDLYQWTITNATENTDYTIDNLTTLGDSITITWLSGYSGTATVTVKALGCAETEVSDSFTVQVTAPPAATITPMGVTSLPLGSDTLALVANDGMGLSYQWLMDGMPLPGETSRMFNAFEPGDYQVDVTQNGCTTRSAVTSVTQENNHNYVITRILRVEDNGSGSPIEENDLYTLSSTQKNESIAYLDALGRPMQEVLWQASPQVTDQVAPRTYDSRGREFQQYLPYVGGSNGYFQDNGTNQAINYYNSGTNADKGVVQDATPYGATVFEASPLSRPLEQGAPGTNFQPGTGQAMGYQYPVNTAGEVKKWLLNGSNLPYQQGTYPAGRLSVTEQSDEDGRVTKIYTDRLGRTVLSRVVLDGGTASFQDTYYVYDVVNRLSYVLPPEGSDNYTGSAGTPTAGDSTLLNHWAFQYDYDERNNMTRKRVPGSDWQYMIYDSRDRVILSQDGRQREQDEWSFTHYDALNRPIVEGLYYSSQNLSQMQATVATFLTSNENNGEELPEDSANYLLHGSPSLTLNSYEGQHRITADSSITLTTGFSIKNFSDESVTLAIAPAPAVVNNPTFPPLADTQPLQLYYYDDHDFDGDATPDASFDASELTVQQVDLFPILTGKLTGTKTKVLNSGLWLTEAMFYDDKGRVVQSQRENSIGGQDIITTQYSFHGLVLGEWHRQTSDSRHGSEDRTVHTRNEYDQADRLTATHQTIDANDTLQLASYAYNEIGELIDKRLHEESTNQYLQSVDFRYGIRGWLTRINGDSLGVTEQQATGIIDATSADDLFAQALDYDNTVAGLTTNPAYNGNINAIRWQRQGQADPSAYVYGYDSANRLTTGNYFAGSGTAWQASTHFDVAGLTYDKNGNITALQRNAADGSSMDDLVYGYGTGNNRSNQLISVEDAGIDTLGFVDGSTVAVEYLYDGSGNLTQDLNKALDSIGYNHLNLPELVRFSSGNQIRYYYDAQGSKLQQEVSNEGTTTETDYISGRQYENGSLDLLMHAEGRTIFGDSSFVQHYDLKDHLGNVRLTFSSETVQASMSASMETGGNSPALEEQYFDNIAETRQTLEFHNATKPTTDEPSPNKVATLNAANGRTQGPSLKQVVHRGDSIHLEVKASYEEHSKKKVQAGGILGAITGLFNPSAAGREMVGATETLNEALAGTTLLNRDKTGVPKAYLNYVVLNEDQQVVDQGFVPVSEAARIETGNRKSGDRSPVLRIDSVNHETLAVDLDIAENGYLYTYVSNESNWDVDVHFDQMTMSMSSSQPTVVQNNDYYPFGLTHQQPLNDPTNKYLYNGKELQNELGLGWYAYGARMYDPAIGRFPTIDPISDQFVHVSPYNYAQNNSIRFIDWLGLGACEEGDCPEGSDNNQEPSGISKILYALSQYLEETGELHNQLFGDGEASPEENRISGLTFLVDVLTAHLELSTIDIQPTGSSSKRNVVTKADDVPNVIYRGDSRGPGVIFKEGFQSQGDNLDLLDHASALFGSDQSAFVSTSKSKKVAKQFAGSGGFVYEIDATKVRGVDVNKALGKSSPYPHEQEIAVPYIVPADAVKQVQINYPVLDLFKIKNK